MLKQTHILTLVKKLMKKYPTFKIGDTVRISKYKNIFARRYTPNWSEKGFLIKKVKNSVLQTYVINYLNGEEISRMFYESELQNQIKNNLELKK